MEDSIVYVYPHGTNLLEREIDAVEERRDNCGNKALQEMSGIQSTRGEFCFS